MHNTAKDTLNLFLKTYTQIDSNPKKLVEIGSQDLMDQLEMNFHKILNTLVLTLKTDQM